MPHCLSTRTTTLLLLLILFGAALPAAAQDYPPPGVHLAAEMSGVRLSYRSAGLAMTNLPGLEPAAIGGYWLPARLVAVRLADNAPLDVRLLRVRSQPFQGTLQPVDPPIPQPSDAAPRPALARAIPAALPNAPVTVLREARLRDTRVAVVALSPVFASAQSPQLAVVVEAFIPGAVPLHEDAGQLLDTPGPFLSSASGPSNPLTSRTTWVVQVDRPGIQRLTRAALASAGLDLGSIDTGQLRLWRQGAELPLEVRGVDELRFYAPTPGDRWNATDTYWLDIDTTEPGLRITPKTVPAGSAPFLTTALERGIWRDNRVYDSTLPGPDGDHWFAALLKTGPELPPASVTLPLTPTLPLAGGTTVLTVTGSAFTGSTPAGQPPRDHTLQVAMSGASAARSWNGMDDWSFRFTLAANQPSVQIDSVPGNLPSGLEVDSAIYERAVNLSFNGQGAFFNGVSGTKSYQLSDTPPGRALYDITSPRAPVLLAIPDGATTTFQDGPAAGRYLLAGPGTLHEPAVTAHAPIDLAAPQNADVVYAAPAALHAALTPLTDLRRAQGYRVAVVDTQAIYDSWSFGQVAPEAIRQFLRYTAATWNPAPSALVLVGDGTSDPLDYTRRGPKNVNLVPPYLAPVDPWLIETACDTCYGLLTTDDPLDDPLPDMAVGRLPVKNAAELQALVAKLVGYETLASGIGWRSRALILADNAFEADGRPDPAGNFPVTAEQAVGLLPARLQPARIYFDPWQKDGNGNPLNEPWRVSDPKAANQQTIAGFQDAGLTVYNGHGSPFRIAVTDVTATPSSLLSSNDVDLLTGEATPIALQMTCYTSAFQTPTVSGMSIDERLVLNTRGGAIGVWGPTGQGVAHGHDMLQRGFLTTLSAKPGTARLGELTTAGYLELFSQGGCCQDIIRTFVLLGDPLTRNGLVPAWRLSLPMVRR